jgi:hypothetical protein
MQYNQIIIKYIQTISILFIISQASYASTTNNDTNTLIYKINDSAIVVPSKYLVNIYINTHALANQQENIKKAAINSLQNILNNSKWSVIGNKSTPAENGSTYIKLTLQSKLSYKELQALKQAYSKNSTNQSVDIKVKNMVAPDNEIYQKVQCLKNKIKENASTYTQDINNKTNNNFFIKSIKYKEDNQALLKSNKIILNATIILSERNPIAL